MRNNDLRAAIVGGKNHALDELFIETANHKPITKGGIYLAAISSIEPSLNAVFVYQKDNQKNTVFYQLVI